MIEYKNIVDAEPEVQEKVRQWRNSSRVKAGMLDQSEIVPEQHRRWLETLASKEPRRIVRVAFKDGIPFGVLNLTSIDRIVGSSDWGFYIGDETFLGKRLGRRLVYDVLEWGFTGEQLNKLYSSVRSDNLGVLHMDMAGGCHIEGYLKNHMCSDMGELIGVYLIAQFKEEWNKNREKISSWSKIGD